MPAFAGSLLRCIPYQYTPAHTNCYLRPCIAKAQDRLQLVLTACSWNFAEAFLGSGLFSCCRSCSVSDRSAYSQQKPQPPSLSLLRLRFYSRQRK